MVSNYQKALQRLWNGLCDVYVRRTEVNKANGRNEPQIVPVHQNIPCRLSFSSITSTSENSEAALIQQAAKLFLAKNIEVSPGSKIVVTQEGKTGSYVRSGEPAVYRCHQEIMLERFKEWA